MERTKEDSAKKICKAEMLDGDREEGKLKLEKV